MRELQIRSRAPWLIVPVLAFGVTIAVTTAGADREPLTQDDAGLLVSAFLVLFAFPFGVMLALVRTFWGWVTAVSLLTALCIAAQVMAAATSEESSTAGLAFLWIPFFGTAGVVLVAGAEQVVRSRRRGRGLVAPG